MLVTWTLTAPAAWAGVTAVIEVLFTTCDAGCGRPAQLHGGSGQETGAGDGHACSAVGWSRVGSDRSHRRRRIGLRPGVGIAIGQGAALGIGVGDHDADGAGRMGRSNGRDGVCCSPRSHRSRMTRPASPYAPARNPVPVIVTAVPPLVVPELGVIAVTVGAA